MLLPHIPRHAARYMGTRIAETGGPLSLGRLTHHGRCTLWLDEGGIHFDRPGNNGAMLLPRRCLLKAVVNRRGLGRVVDVWWTGADDAVWISRFSVRAGEDWAAAVERLKAATQEWEHPGAPDRLP